MVIRFLFTSLLEVPISFPIDWSFSQLWSVPYYFEVNHPPLHTFRLWRLHEFWVDHLLLDLA